MAKIKIILMFLGLLLLTWPSHLLADNEWSFRPAVLINPGSPIAIGDSNHDGKTELIYRVIENNQFSVRIYEYQNGNYQEVYRLDGARYIPWVSDDLDNDDKKEIIVAPSGQNSYNHHVYNWQNGWQHVGQIAVPNLSNGWVETDDINRNGYSEIITGSGNAIGSANDMVWEYRNAPNQTIPID